MGTGPTQDTTISNQSRSANSKASFATFGLSKNILRAVTEAGFTEPRPIQAKAMPKALAGSDVLGLAQTGTGKTAAFALPILERLSQSSGGQKPRALIVSPTRELALQIHAEIELLGKYTNVRAISIIGGVGAGAQVRALRKQPDIVVACPGRLLDLMGSGEVKLGGVEVLVLDEADHMLDMGFLPDIKRILAKLPQRRQNLLFSATMPNEIRGLATRVLHKPHTVELTSSAPAETIEHALYAVEQSGKAALLKKLLSADDFRSAIVFLRTKHRARRLAQDLEKAGYQAVALQGNMSQGQRQRAMQGFRDGRYDVLVATDIAARGIDVAQVSHVVNFDVPNTPDAYTHRIGRTGRSERSGKAATFVMRDDADAIRAIERKLGRKIPRLDAGSLPTGKGPARRGASRPAQGESSGSGRDSNPSDAPPGRGPKRTRSRSRRGPELAAASSARGAGSRGGQRSSGSNSGPGGPQSTGAQRQRTRSQRTPSAGQGSEQPFGMGISAGGNASQPGKPRPKRRRSGR